MEKYNCCRCTLEKLRIRTFWIQYFGVNPAYWDSSTAV